MSEIEKDLEVKSEPKDKKENKKPAKKPRKNSKIKKWFRDLKAELKKVVWPTKKHVIHNTIVVLVTVILAMVLIAGADLAFKLISNTLISLGK